ncbi:MAG: hypothetical protein ACFCUI_02790 [Bernardetiaceae bacterium]
MKKLFLNAFSLSLALLLIQPFARAQKDDIVDLINSIPSPVELSSLIKSQNASYKRSLLNDSKKVSNYTTSYDRALNLGIYAADLGFASLYGRNVDALDYLGAIKELANALSIGQFLDEETIREAANASNVDQLLLSSTQSLEKVNKQLQRDGREHLSLLFVAGSWLEGLHLATATYAEAGNDKLKERIGEQKIALEQLMKVMNMYKDKPGYAGLLRDFGQLEQAYKNVSIVSTGGKSETKIVDGEAVITGGGKNVVNISNDDVLSITSLVAAIRKKHVR